MAKLVDFRKNPADLLKARSGFRLADVDPAAAPGYSGGKKDGAALLAAQDDLLAGHQEQLFASGRFGGKQSVLLVLQAMDTAGKGGIVSHVVGAVDPHGIQHHAFKAPTPAEKRHDFLWRIRRQLPEPGMLGVFDRSHYEDVLIHRARGLSPLDVIEQRYEAIRAFEEELVAGGTRMVKVMLHISPEEQKRRLLKRLERTDKLWKYSPQDIKERAFWAHYMEAYQIAIERTSTETAPWYVVPADRKWYARVAVQEILLGTLKAMDLKWPRPDFDVAEERRKISLA